MGLHNANDAAIDAPEGWDAAGLGASSADGEATVVIVDTGTVAAKANNAVGVAA